MTRSPWPTFAIASVAVFLVSLDATVLYAAFPALRSAFPDASPPDLSWVLNAYTVVYAALLVPAGRFADLRGRKQTFLAGVALFVIGSVACGLAPNAGALIGARAGQAIGAALLLPASLAIVLGAFPAERRAVAVSLWGAVSGLAAAIGPSAGSLLVDHFGWRSAFFINLPIGLFTIWRGARVLVESRDPSKGARIDFVGVALLIAGVGALALGLVRSQELGWTAASVLGPLVAGPLALALFVAWARRAPSPAIDLSLFRDRTYRFVNLATLCFGAAFAIMFFSFFSFMVGLWHYSLSRAGVAVTPGPLLVIPTAIICGRIAARVGHRRLLVGGALVFASAGLWFASVPGVEPHYLTHYLPGLVLSGLGTGMVLPSLSAAAVAHLPPARFGVGSAVNQAIRQIGGVLGVAIAVVVAGGASPTIGDFTAIGLWMAGLAMATAVLCAPVDTRPR